MTSGCLFLYICLIYYEIILKENNYAFTIYAASLKFSRR